MGRLDKNTNSDTNSYKHTNRYNKSNSKSNINTNTSIRGVDERYLSVRNYQLDEGDFFTKSQMDTRGLVAVLGASVTNTLFPEGGAVGRNIRINRTQFRVIGTLVHRLLQRGTDPDGAEDAITAAASDLLDLEGAAELDDPASVVRVAADLYRRLRNTLRVKAIMASQRADDDSFGRNRRFQVPVFIKL